MTNVIEKNVKNNICVYNESHLCTKEINML